VADTEQQPDHGQISRREFVQGTSQVAAGVALGLTASGQQGPVVGASRPRVVRAFDKTATSWDYVSNYYFDFIDQAVVDRMFLKSLLVLTGEATVRAACHQAFPTYQPGDKIAIKINLNNTANQSNDIDATAPVLNAVLLALTVHLGMPPGDIYVYDVSRAIPAFRIRNRVPWSVNYVQSGDSLAQANPAAPIQFRNIATQYCPFVLTQAAHLIDLCRFKNHLYVLGTMAMKNHFGTTRPGPSYLHTPISPNLSDLNATPHIRYKTRLIVGDALFGIYSGGPYGRPQRWATFPGGPTPNSIFVGFDPVATESVMTDYLIAEQVYRGVPLLSHDYLHDAMTTHGLGYHEHRAANGSYAVIDYRQILGS
jgi:hypothetical protein